LLFASGEARGLPGWPHPSKLSTVGEQVGRRLGNSISPGNAKPRSAGMAGFGTVVSCALQPSKVVENALPT